MKPVCKVRKWLAENGPAEIRAVARGSGVPIDEICRMRGDKWDRRVNPPLLVSVAEEPALFDQAKADADLARQREDAEDISEKFRAMRGGQRG